jgi:sulfonate transport system ATP-binding protein
MTANVPDAHPAVRARDLSVAYGSNSVLRGLDVEIAKGEFVALLGRSGSGKTTLLRVLAGLQPQSAGSLDVPPVRAVVFQEPRLLPWKRVVANVAIGLRAPNATARAAAALREVGLEHRISAWPATLSGGEAQRAGLARALVRDPQFLLLDEPFASIDALTRLRMHDLVIDLWRSHGPAVLLVTHDVDEALLLADRVYVLDAGRIAANIPVALGRPRQPAHPQFAALRREILTMLGVPPAAAATASADTGHADTRTPHQLTTGVSA